MDNESSFDKAGRPLMKVHAALAIPKDLWDEDPRGYGMKLRLGTMWQGCGLWGQTIRPLLKKRPQFQ